MSKKKSNVYYIESLYFDMVAIIIAASNLFSSSSTGSIYIRANLLLDIGKLSPMIFHLLVFSSKERKLM